LIYFQKLRRRAKVLLDLNPGSGPRTASRRLLGSAENEKYINPNAAVDKVIAMRCPRAISSAKDFFAGVRSGALPDAR